jgi:MarR family transcriptional regulator for hemolysin
LSQRDALLTLNHHGPATHLALTERLGLEQSSVSRLVDGLSRHGFVAVQTDDSDRRSRVVSLTKEGRRLLNRTPGTTALAGSALTGALTPAETEELIRLLRKCAEALETENS